MASLTSPSPQWHPQKTQFVRQDFLLQIQHLTPPHCTLLSDVSNVLFQNVYQFVLYRITPVSIHSFSGNCFFILHHIYCFYSFGTGWFKQQAGSAPWITIQQFPLWISIELLGECCLVLQIGLIHFISLFENLFYWRFKLRSLFRCVLSKERLQCGMHLQYLFDFAITR